MVAWNLAELGLDPARLGDWTYPMLVAVLTRGRPDAMHAEYWQIRRILADHRAGRMVWGDDANG